MAKEVSVVYASGIKNDNPVVIKNRVMRYMTYLYERYAQPNDDVFEVMFHYDRKTRETHQITIVDSGLAERFQSNLNFEGRITELIAEMQKQRNIIQGYKMREGRMRNKISALEEEVGPYRKHLAERDKIIDELGDKIIEANKPQRNAEEE